MYNFGKVWPVTLLAAFLMGMALPAAADTCTRPAKIKIPDPAKSDAKDFEKAYKDLTAYHSTLTAYNACLDKEAKDAAAEYSAVSQDYEKAVKAYNALADKANKSN